MTNVKLTTLTPVHIGSGKELMANFEYLYFPEEKQAVLVDEAKVLEVIGKENMDHWLHIIENQESLLDYLKTLNPNLKPADVAKRQMQVADQTLKGKNIKEFWHNGQNQPTIPGSSLKGAVRTALFSDLIKSQKEKFRKSILDNFNQYTKGRYRDGFLQKQIFGKNPRQDLLRLLQVGDTHFQHTDVHLVKTLNSYAKGNKPQWEFKSSINQFVEAIPEGHSNEGNFSINEALKKVANGQFNKNEDVLTNAKLINKINAHTLEEIKVEEKNMGQELQASSKNEDFSDYLKQLSRLRKEAEQCQNSDNACVLRMGFGSGWLSITGDWLEDVLPEENEFGPVHDSLRPSRYEGMLFPKTRKMTGDQQPLGFVKLTLKS